jgi:hypothetical protein
MGHHEPQLLEHDVQELIGVETDLRQGQQVITHG